MIYLKEYNYFNEDIINDIKECFLKVLDITDYVSIKKEANSFFVSISLDFQVDDKISISKYGCEYRPVKNGTDLSIEISDAIYHVGEFGLSTIFAVVKWINAGEWSPNSKFLGPGMLDKRFTTQCKNTQIEGVLGGDLPIELLDEFILNKGDRLRYIRIEFKKN